MFLQWPLSPISPLSSAHCLNSGRCWLLALFLMNNTGLNHSAPCHGLWLVNAALTLAADWLLRWIIDGADIFADGWKWIIFHLGRSLSFFQVQHFERRIETASEILSSAHLTCGRCREKMKIRNLQAWKYLKPLDKHFPSHSFIILAWVILRR